ncbi:MAG TPA: GNAT family N-acetyltransferase, partial [Cyanobacteria bacterium UBA8156]|nr:GNAT family N-acetyltransferase [Cyanobacteria bacterium UBA8156]
MMIREANAKDADGIWPIFHEIAAAGETYAYPRDIGRAEALSLWMDSPRQTYVLTEGDQIQGTYYSNCHNT